MWGVPTAGPASSQSVDQAQDFGGLEGVAQGQDPAGRLGGEPGLQVPLNWSTTPLPPALSSGIAVAARSEICQSMFWFNSRKNIPTGEKAALGLWEISDIKNLGWTHTASCRNIGE